MNTVTIAGRVGRDASEGFKPFESGKTKANFSVAVNRWDSKTKAQVTERRCMGQIVRICFSICKKGYACCY